MKILNQGQFHIDIKPKLNIERPLLDHGRMTALIELEQARANRSGEQFCVVTFFPCESITTTNFDLTPLIRLLSQRVRRVDTPGWLESQVVVLLTATSPLGAHAFNEAIIQGLPPGLVDNFVIHAYPEVGSGPSLKQPCDQDKTPEDHAVTERAVQQGPNPVTNTHLHSCLTPSVAKSVCLTF